MSAQTTQEYIDFGAKLQNPVLPLLAIYNYQLTGDEKYITQIPCEHSNRNVKTLCELAVQENLETPASQVVFDVVVHRIVNNKQGIYDDLPAQYAMNCVEIRKTDASNDVGTKLLYALRDKGVDDYVVALMWMQTANVMGPALFDWNYGYKDDKAILQPELHFQLPSDIVANNVFEELVLGLSDADMKKLLQNYTTADVENRKAKWEAGPLQGIIARDRPQVLRQFIDALPEGSVPGHALDWRYVVGATGEFDDECLVYCKKHDVPDPVIALDGLRQGKYAAQALEACMAYDGDSPRSVMAYLADKDDDLLIEKLSAIISKSVFSKMETTSRSAYCKKAATRWSSSGDKVFNRFEYSQLHRRPKGEESDPTWGNTDHKREALFQGALAADSSEADQWLLGLFNSLPADSIDKDSSLRGIGLNKPYLIEDQLWQSLQHRLSTERSNAAEWLVHKSIEDAAGKAVPLLDGDADARLGAIALLTNLGGDASQTLLVEAFRKKQSAKVRSAIAESLKTLGYELTQQDLLGDLTVAEVLAAIEKAKIKQLPKSVTDWINTGTLPDLVTADGTVLSEKAVAHLICVQAKHKTIDAAPDNVVLLSLIDKAKSGDFAVEILKQWLSSSCDAKDKWVMAVAGLLGDRRVLPALTDPIQGWAKNARHKLAEYAALGVALIPTSDALMLLDLLATRYRSKYRNIGKACKAALEKSAEMQKVSMDELGDMIVPTFDFNSDYQRALPDTDIKVLLQPDFKMTFYNPTTDKETKTAPAAVPDNARAEVTAVKKLITKMVKQQTARLERALVHQRKWETSRWQEYFETNPFLQSYASRLVWATLDKEGQLIKLFRRYPNGLLANAAGDLIELDDNDRNIELVHPLNLDGDVLQRWKAHLTRMKVKQPFAQLDRPTAALYSSHGNRKSIAFTDQHQIAIGTLRSRATKLGWEHSSQGSGSIDSYCKVFVGAGIGAFLRLEPGAYLGQEPIATVTLGPALFVNGEPTKQYGGFSPEPVDTDDESVMVFSEVPAGIYSEVVTDLKTIVAET